MSLDGLYKDGAGGERRLHDDGGGYGTELRKKFLHDLFADRFIGDGQDQGHHDRKGRREVILFDKGDCRR